MVNDKYEIDATTGNAEFTIPKPKAEGEIIEISCKGEGLVFIKGQVCPLIKGISINLISRDITPMEDVTTLEWHLTKTTYGITAPLVDG